MKRAAVTAVLLAMFTSANAQYKVHFVFKHLPAYQQATDTIYLAGSFNQWNPKDPKTAVPASSLDRGITIELPKGMMEYKFTLGSWDEVESGNEGAPVANRNATLESDTTIAVNIAQWASHFPKKAKESTASKNVHILDTAFYMPQLNRHRRVWIYLPPSYASTRKKYPVLYMHDGQNLFDNATAPYGEWGIDEALDSLDQTGEAIVVAVDHGGDKRINEYSPFDMERYGKGEGDAYVDFLMQTLMPYINQHYRTKKSARFTAVAGSSMGGLISFYAALKYPNKFGTAGVFSPAFWIVPQLQSYATQRARKAKGNFYFYAGQQESKSMVPDMLSVFEILNKGSKATLKSHIRAEGQHNESTWREEFPQFFTWWMQVLK